MTPHPAFPGVKFPGHFDIYYGGAWHAPKSGLYVETASPANGEVLAKVACGGAADADAAVTAAKDAFPMWKNTAPLERAKLLRQVAQVIRQHAEELALLDAADGGNPAREMLGDAVVAASFHEFFAGLVTEMKGHSIPMGPASVNFSIREPLGVVARILPFNHPFMFCAGKIAAPLAAGNTVVIKPPEQAPLSGIRLAELLHDVLPPGVFNVVPGGREAGQALASHPDVAKIAVIGSVPTGRAVMKAASDTLKPVLLELGGKNALIAFGDADPDQVAAAAIAGMNFTWCGQSCGSTSRAFIHSSLYDKVVVKLAEKASAFKPGLPTDFDTSMGAIVSKLQYDRIMSFIHTTISEGGRLICGGRHPDDPKLARGYFIEPTVFADMRPDMTIARQEVFGPVLAVFRWEDEDAMLQEVNGVEYGLTCSIWTNNLQQAHRTASAVQAGYVWVNETSRHFLGAPFGGYKQSGIGREESFEELLAFTQEKHIHIRIA